MAYKNKPKKTFLSINFFRWHYFLIVFQIYRILKKIDFLYNYFFLSFKIDNITLDPDPNWGKILGPDPNSMHWIHKVHSEIFTPASLSLLHPLIPECFLFLHFSISASPLSWIRPILNASFSTSHLSWIRPILSPSLYVSLLSSIPHFLRLSFPAFLLYCIPHFLLSYLPESVFSCFRPFLSFAFSASLLNYSSVSHFLHFSFPASLLPCTLPFGASPLPCPPLSNITPFLHFSFYAKMLRTFGSEKLYKKLEAKERNILWKKLFRNFLLQGGIN